MNGKSKKLRRYLLGTLTVFNFDETQIEENGRLILVGTIPERSVKINEMKEYERQVFRHIFGSKNWEDIVPEDTKIEIKPEGEKIVAFDFSNGLSVDITRSPDDEFVTYVAKQKRERINDD